MCECRRYRNAEVAVIFAASWETSLWHLTSQTSTRVPEEAKQHLNALINALDKLKELLGPALPIKDSSGDAFASTRNLRVRGHCGRGFLA